MRKWDIIAWEGFISSISIRIRTVFAHEQSVRPTEWAAYCQITHPITRESNSTAGNIHVAIKHSVP